MLGVMSRRASRTQGIETDEIEDSRPDCRPSSAIADIWGGRPRPDALRQRQRRLAALDGLRAVAERTLRFRQQLQTLARPRLCSRLRQGSHSPCGGYGRRERKAVHERMPLNTRDGGRQGLHAVQSERGLPALRVHRQHLRLEPRSLACTLVEGGRRGKRTRN